MRPPTRRRHYRLTFAVLLVAVTSFSLLQSLVIPVLPAIQHGLHTSQDTVTWVLTAYLLSASVATPIVGRSGDTMGKKKMLVATVAVLAIGCLLGALATSIGVMIVARVIQGVVWRERHGLFATAACLIIPSTRRDERALLDAASVVGHAETALVAGATLFDVE